MAKSCETNDINGLNNAMSNVSLNNTRKPIYRSPFVRRKQQQQQQILSQIQQYQNSDSFGAGTSMPRRQSIVKPTWQNVCPGEVPHETLDRLNQLSNGDQSTILFNQHKVIYNIHRINPNSKLFPKQIKFNIEFNSMHNCFICIY